MACDLTESGLYMSVLKIASEAFGIIVKICSPTPWKVGCIDLIMQKKAFPSITFKDVASGGLVASSVSLIRQCNLGILKKTGFN